MPTFLFESSVGNIWNGRNKSSVIGAKMLSLNIMEIVVQIINNFSIIGYLIFKEEVWQMLF